MESNSGSDQKMSNMKLSQIHFPAVHSPNTRPAPLPPAPGPERKQQQHDQQLRLEEHGQDGSGGAKGTRDGRQHTWKEKEIVSMGSCFARAKF